jgi:hypothetical protein
MVDDFEPRPTTFPDENLVPKHVDLNQDKEMMEMEFEEEGPKLTVDVSNLLEPSQRSSQRLIVNKRDSPRGLSKQRPSYKQQQDENMKLFFENLYWKGPGKE